MIRIRKMSFDAERRKTVELRKEITFFKKRVIVSCDGRCDLAVGTNPPREETCEGGDVWGAKNYRSRWKWK